MPAAETAENLKLLRVDQVGGLCPPAGLRQVFEAWKSGKARADELDRAKDEAVRQHQGVR